MKETIIPNHILYKSDVPPVLFEVDSLGFNIYGYEQYLLKSSTEIKVRQEVFRDIAEYPALKDKFRQLYEKFDELTTFFTKYGTLDNAEEIIYSIIEMRSFTDIIGIIAVDFKGLVDSGAIKAHDMVQFINACKEFSESALYLNISDWLEKLDLSMKNIKSVTLGANLDAQLKIIEIGIVSLNEHPYVSNKLIDSIFREKASPKEYKCIASLGIHETKKLIGQHNVSINSEMFSSFNTLFKRILKNLNKSIIEAFNAEVAALMSVKDDILFIVNASEYMLGIINKGASVVFPAAEEYTEIHDLYNSELIYSRGIKNLVPNNAVMNDVNHSFILTGPNSGGKSVYLNSVGIAQLLFQLGLPIPAASAKMRIFDMIASIYIHDTVNTKSGRLADEVRRLKECIDKLHKNTLLLLDETFSSTSAFDGVFLAESLIKYLSKRGCYHIYITHFHELAARIDVLNNEGYQIQMLTAQNINGVRTYKIVHYDGASSETSLAKDIVIENGLGFLFD